MRQWVKSPLLFALVALCVATPLLAQTRESPEEPPPGEIPDFGAIVREGEIIIDAILEHHIDPPDRKELWFEGVKGLVNPPRVPRPASRVALDAARFDSLRAEIRQLTTSDELAGLLKELWSDGEFPKSRLYSFDPKQAFLDGILLAAPGGANLIPRSELKAQEQLRGNRYIGIGIASGYDDERGYPSIGMVIPNGPLAQAGGRAEELILKIDGRDTHRMPLAQAIELIRGEEGTKVTLELCPRDQVPPEVKTGVAGAPQVSTDGPRGRTVVVTRGPVVLETLEGLQEQDSLWEYLKPGMPIRYVKIKNINGSTVHDLRKFEIQFRREGGTAIVLDFRAMYAADLHYAVLLADALLDGGPIGRLRTKDHIRDFHADRDCLFRDLPLAILVSQETRGGGEWVAAALQDSGQAIVVGEQTAGNAFVDSTIALSGSGNGLRLATGIFERPSGRPFQTRRGRRDPADDAPETPGNESGIRPDTIVGPPKPGDAVSNVVTVIGERIFDRRAGQDAILAEAVRVLQVAVKMGNGRVTR